MRGLHFLEMVFSHQCPDGTEGLLPAEGLRKWEAWCTAGEIHRTSEKLHFEQGYEGDFGCKEMDEVGDLRKGHYGER